MEQADGYTRGVVEGERAAAQVAPRAPAAPGRARLPLVLAVIALCAGTFYWTYSRFNDIGQRAPGRTRSLAPEQSPWRHQFSEIGLSAAPAAQPPGTSAGPAAHSLLDALPGRAPLPGPGALPPLLGPLPEYPLPEGSPGTPDARADAARTAVAATRQTGASREPDEHAAASASAAEILVADPWQRGAGTAGDDSAALHPAGSAYATVNAALLPDRDYLLAAGSTIECVLQTRIDSTLPGMTSCLLTRRVLSDNGGTVLLERGSLVTGEYRSSVALGQNRLFVLWKRIKTPLGVTIDLESPATDALGASGVGGDLDEHWGERLGAAFLLSFIQDALAYSATGRASASGDGTTVILPNTTQSGNQLAGKVLESTIGIAPTLTLAQGERIMIFVARDLRFDSVYDVSVTRAP